MPFAEPITRTTSGSPGSSLSVATAPSSQAAFGGGERCWTARLIPSSTAAARSRSARKRAVIAGARGCSPRKLYWGDLARPCTLVIPASIRTPRARRVVDRSRRVASDKAPALIGRRDALNSRRSRTVPSVASMSLNGARSALCRFSGGRIGVVSPGHVHVLDALHSEEWLVHRVGRGAGYRCQDTLHRTRLTRCGSCQCSRRCRASRMGHLDGAEYRKSHLGANATNIDGTVVAFVKRGVERVGGCDAASNSRGRRGGFVASSSRPRCPLLLCFLRDPIRNVALRGAPACQLERRDPGRSVARDGHYDGSVHIGNVCPSLCWLTS